MTQITLYTGGGVSLSPQNTDDRIESNYVRLFADKGMGITDGNVIAICIDVLAATAAEWTDCELPPIGEEATAEDYEAALAELGVR